TPTGDTWTFDSSFAWTKVSSANSPAARYSPAMAGRAGTVVLFGGSSGSSLFADTWVFDGTTWTQSGATGPTGRIAHAMATQGTHVLLFGGNTSDTATWSFDGAAWTSLGSAGPALRADHAMATLP